MRQISAGELREIATDIEGEMTRLSSLEEQIQLVQTEISKQPNLSNIFYESQALKLHNFYTGCERIFQIVASELNGGLPSGYDLHRRLLTRMSTAQKQRPALLTRETAKKLEEYLAFRHVVRNIYGFELVAQRVEGLVQGYYLVWQQFGHDVQEFLHWLRTLADEIESS